VAAQDTIIMYDGRHIPIKNYNLNEELQEIEYTSAKGKTKVIDLEDAFSIKSSDKEKILYQTDSSKSQYMCVDDMKCYVKGAESANESYAATVATVAGLVIGAGSMAYAMADNTKLNMLMAPLVPLSFCIGISLTKPCESRIKQRYPEWSNNERFVAGYKNQARKKRVRNAIVSSAAGMLFSFATMSLISISTN
jgi:hypothetical protein